MEPVYTSETTVLAYHILLFLNKEDHNMNLRHCENLLSRTHMLT